MNANELRIGNYWTNGHKIYKADANTIYDLENAPEDVKVNYKGVCLTAAHLKDFRFTKYREKKYRKRMTLACDLQVEFEKSKISLSIIKHETKRNEAFKFRYIDFVHELQNVFFWLSKQELTIKSTK